jgi:hypothetical protein
MRRERHPGSIPAASTTTDTELAKGRGNAPLPGVRPLRRAMRGFFEFTRTEGWIFWPEHAW